MSVAATGLDELETLLASNTVAGTIGRGVLTGLSALAVSDIINAFSHSSAQTKAKHANAHFAIVDLANNQVVTFLSRKRVYRLLTRSGARKSRHTTHTVRVIPVGSTNSSDGLTVLR